MNEPHSVTHLIEQIEAGDSLAAHRVWDRFIHRLVGLARKKLKTLPRRAVDEEDVALSAFNAFFEGMEDDRFEKLDDRDDLWQVLAMLTERKAIGAIRRELAQKRGGGPVNRDESVFGPLLLQSSGRNGIQHVADPSPDAVDGFTRGVRELLETLTDTTEQSIALLKLKGCTNQEVADEIGISLRGIERKVALIRTRWEQA